MADQLVVPARVAPGEIRALCERVWPLFAEGGPALVVCDVGACSDDLATVDALARIQLTAKRSGGAVRFRGAAEELRRILDLVGLAGVLPCEGSVQMRGQAEQREPPGGVQEEDDPGDPAVG